jgi:hypothetical protein
LPNVYSFVPPPKGTDLTTASKSTLMKHGLLMRKPDQEREPERFARWLRFARDIWTEEKFVPPTFGHPESVTHNLKGSRRPKKDVPVTYGDCYNNSWGGIAVVGAWVGAMGTWSVPTVTQPDNPPSPATPAANGGGWQSASWVGLDGGAGIIEGTNSTDVLQAGVSQNLDSTGQPAYYAWYEWSVLLDGLTAMDPQYPYVFPIPITSMKVDAGDTITVVVQYVKHMGDDIADPIPPAGPYSFGGILLTNETSGEAVNLYLPPPPGGSFIGDSAEWIMECPTCYLGGTFPQFSTVHFDDAGACNVGDAPPGSDIGVELQKATRCFLVNKNGSLGNLVYGDLGTVDIVYQDYDPNP